jgi:hypothetical protein
MFTLIVIMYNGTCVEFDFLDKTDAIEYARVRKMGQNKAIRRHVIKEFPFSQWLKNKGLYHG